MKLKFCKIIITVMRQGKQMAVNVLENIHTKLNESFPEDLVARH